MWKICIRALQCARHAATLYCLFRLCLETSLHRRQSEKNKLICSLSLMRIARCCFESRHCRKARPNFIKGTKRCTYINSDRLVIRLPEEWGQYNIIPGLILFNHHWRIWPVCIWSFILCNGNLKRIKTDESMAYRIIGTSQTKVSPSLYHDRGAWDWSWSYFWDPTQVHMLLNVM